MPRALIVGGTGPTGVPLANLFLRHGYDVSILHSGAHPAGFDGIFARVKAGGVTCGSGRSRRTTARSTPAKAGAPATGVTSTGA